METDTKMAQVLKLADKDFKATTVVMLKDSKEIIVISEQMQNHDRKLDTRKNLKRNQIEIPELKFWFKI